MVHGRSRIWAALALGLLWLATLAPATSLAGNPSTDAWSSVSFDGCSATVSAGWVAQPGRVKTFQLWLSNNVDGTMYDMGSGAVGRTGSISTPGRLVTGSSRTFTARLYLYDGKGTILQYVPSPGVGAACQ